MSILKIALLQLAPCGNLRANLEKGISACRKAKKMGAEIALFPEMWSIGYGISRPAEEWKKEAVPADGEFVNAFGRLARELEMAIGITFLEKIGPASSGNSQEDSGQGKENQRTDPRNSVALFDRFGRLQFVYAKVHTCDFGDERNLTPGDDFTVTGLDTASCGIVRTGAMICYDREFPESARILMLKGAELILVPNACPMEINRLSQLRGRAYENMTAVATCNYPKDVPDCNGNSTVFDGVAFLPGESDSRDTCILQAGSDEGIYVADLDVSLLRKYREHEVQGNAYRHPRKYGILTETKIEAPFIRDDYRP
ncbi:MAG: carbon-nitrogen hydrolase family protein [Lachnospiraceae bacterium]|jgi:predicted amidohydrolase